MLVAHLVASYPGTVQVVMHMNEYTTHTYTHKYMCPCIDTHLEYIMKDYLEVESSCYDFYHTHPIIL